MGASKSKPTVDLQQIVDVIPQTITVLDPDGTIIYANQAVLDYTGLTIDDVMKSDFRDRVFHPEDVKRLRDERQQALLRGKPSSPQNCLATKRVPSPAPPSGVSVVSKPRMAARSFWMR